MWRTSPACGSATVGEKRCPFEVVSGWADGVVCGGAVKAYDERYFHRWYHNRGTRVITPADRGRRVAMVLSVSEFLLGRRLRSVLDIGCGEAPWAPILRKERPRLHYIGVDSSEYAVRKFGRRRNIHLGNFGDFDAAVPEGEFDLVVASDVIHYLTRGEFERGLPRLVARTGGIAYLDFFTSADNMEGDRKEMRLRSPGYYRRVFADAGFTQLGLQFYSTAQVARNLSALEHPH